MDVDSVSLNGYNKEKVFVDQPPDFINPSFPNHVFKLKKKVFTDWNKSIELDMITWANFYLKTIFKSWKVGKTLLSRNMSMTFY